MRKTFTTALTAAALTAGAFAFATPAFAAQTNGWSDAPAGVPQTITVTGITDFGGLGMCTDAVAQFAPSVGGTPAAGPDVNIVNGNAAITFIPSKVGTWTATLGNGGIGGCELVTLPAITITDPVAVVNAKAALATDATTARDAATVAAQEQAATIAAIKAGNIDAAVANAQSATVASSAAQAAYQDAVKQRAVLDANKSYYTDAQFTALVDAADIEVADAKTASEAAAVSVKAATDAVVAAKPAEKETIREIERVVTQTQTQFVDRPVTVLAPVEQVVTDALESKKQTARVVAELAIPFAKNGVALSKTAQARLNALVKKHGKTANVVYVVHGYGPTVKVSDMRGTMTSFGLSKAGVPAGTRDIAPAGKYRATNAYGKVANQVAKKASGNVAIVSVYTLT